MGIRKQSIRGELTEEQVINYSKFIPWLKIYHVVQHNYKPSEGNKPEKLIFAVNFGDRFCIFGFGLKIINIKKKDFEWWSGNANGRILNGTDDDILSCGISVCIRENLEEIYHAGKTYDTIKAWKITARKMLKKAKQCNWI